MRLSNCSLKKWFFIVLFFSLFTSFIYNSNDKKSFSNNSQLIFDQSPLSQGNSASLNRYVTDQEFNSDVLTGTEWIESSGTYANVLSNYLELADGNVNVRYNVPKQDGDKVGFKDAQILIRWSWDLNDWITYSPEVKLQYSENSGSSWSSISGSTKTNSNSGYIIEYYSLSGLNADSTTQLLFRIIASSMYANQYVRVDRIRIATFQSSLTDDSVVTSLGNSITNLENNLHITVSMTRFGVESGLPNTDVDLNHYSIYYSTTSSDYSTFSSVLSASGSFSGTDTATLSFNIQCISNSTLNYDFRVQNSAHTYVYRTNVQTVLFYDDISPSISPLPTTPLSSIFEPNMNLKISGYTSDSGGMGLKHITIFWGNSDLNNTHYIGTETHLLSGSGSVYYEFIIDKSYFTLDQTLYYQLCVFDNSYRNFTSAIYSITPRDLTKPQIIASILNNQSIGYQSNKTLSFNITEAEGTSGVNALAVDCSFSIGNNDFSNATRISSFQQNGINWTGTIGALNFSRFNQTVYVWVRANDTANNQQNLTCVFTTLDLYTPSIDSSLVPSSQNLSSIVGSYFTFYVSVQDDLGGSGINHVKLCYGLNSDATWTNISTIITAIALPNNQYKILIPKNNLTAGSLNFKIIATDLSGNSLENSGIISLVGSAINSDENENLGTQNPALDPNLMTIIYAVIGVAIGSVVMITVQKKIRAKRFATKTDAIFAKSYVNPPVSSSGNNSASSQSNSEVKSPANNEVSSSKPNEDGWSNIQSPSPIETKAAGSPLETQIIKSEESMDYMNKALNTPDPKVSIPNSSKIPTPKPLPSISVNAPASTISNPVSAPILAPEESSTIPSNKPASKPIPNLPPLATNLKTSTVSLPSNSLPSVAPLPATQAPILETFTPEMRDLYLSAQEAVTAGEESLAVKSYETLLRLAEKKGDSDQIAFIKRQIEKF